MTGGHSKNNTAKYIANPSVRLGSASGVVNSSPGTDAASGSVSGENADVALVDAHGHAAPSAQ